MQTETKWGKSKKRASKNCWKIQNDIVKSKLESQKEEREIRAEEILEEILAKNSPKLMKE